MYQALSQVPRNPWHTDKSPCPYETYYLVNVQCLVQFGSIVNLSMKKLGLER